MEYPLVAPSLLSADFLELGRAVDLCNRSAADWIHCDVMDGAFVPNISFGLPVIAAVKRAARKPLDVHLMIERPDRYIDAFRKAGADILTVHVEADRHLDRTLRAIAEAGMTPGVSLNPATPVEALSEVLPLVGVVLVMSVNPGFGGQSFLPNTYGKLRRLRAMCQAQNVSPILEVDGGVSDANAGLLVEAGATALVAGAYVFGAADPEAAIDAIKRPKAPAAHV